MNEWINVKDRLPESRLPLIAAMQSHGRVHLVRYFDGAFRKLQKCPVMNWGFEEEEKWDQLPVKDIIYYIELPPTPEPPKK